MDANAHYDLNSVVMLFMRLLAIFPLFYAGGILAQNLSLPLPRRPADALDGNAFARKTTPLDLVARDEVIANEVLAGNVPDFLRTFCPVTVTNISDHITNVGTFFVAPDYLAVGADTNYLFVPISPDTAQGIADKLDCTLPTRKMVDAVYAAAMVKLAPSPIPPSAAMTTVPVFVEHNKTIWAQRMALTNAWPLGALVAGEKKDVVISRRLLAATNNVAIYGWHKTNGVPIQPLYLGHAWWWVDYSQCIRLVSKTMLVNGKEKSIADVLADPKLCGLISDEGVIANTRYSTNFSWPDKINLPWPEKFSPSLGRSETQVPPALRAVTAQRAVPTYEWTRDIRTLDGVRILINSPAPESISADTPIELVFYALPNGNTIEETTGRRLRPGDDWHFDIQHIGAQTRWLRQVITNRALVVAYLEANTKSWPAWRKTHQDRRIAEIVDGVCGIFRSNRTDVVLASHSGGGSFVFGYVNAVNEIPDNVERIAFLDSDYGYDSTLHANKIISWLGASEDHRLCVIAYQDYLALYEGKPFVSEAGGTWGRSRVMLGDLSVNWPDGGERRTSNSAVPPALLARTAQRAVPTNGFFFTNETNSAGLEIYSTTNRQIEFLLKENPERKIWHTVQVERNGFIQALLSGTDLEGHGYQYLGERAYTNQLTR
ncbi:MAG TPA: hypothetical protein VME24_03730 [Alphaproteobacteria bacterium]|nr:hypothetical protein [Alphaproteobacteria bacterium]